MPKAYKGNALFNFENSSREEMDIAADTPDLDPISSSGRDDLFPSSKERRGKMMKRNPAYRLRRSVSEDAGPKRTSMNAKALMSSKTNKARNIRSLSPLPKPSGSLFRQDSDNALKKAVMFPAVATAKLMVGAGQLTANAVVGGSKAIVEGTMKGIRSATHLGSSTASRKSKWEEGIEVIDSLLDPTGDVYQAMSAEQRMQLAGVKKLLLKAPTGKNSTTQHVPRELLQIEIESQRNMISQRNMLSSSVASSTCASFAGSSRVLSSTDRRPSNFILQEYAGIRDATRIIEDFAEESAEFSVNDLSTIASTAESTTFADDASLASQQPPPKTVQLEKYSVPPEFTYMDREAQLKVYEMVKWENLQKWDFNVFDLNKATNGQPLLFVGWAILNAPYSHHAMALELGLESDVAALPGYRFGEELNLPQDKLISLLTTIEKDYTKGNPYHNNIHAADVCQSLHALIQSSKDEEFMKDCPKINLFSVLLAAVCHDVCHPGTTNAFHTKLHNEVAVLYNDSSVLENWHVAHAFSRMLGLDLRGPDLFTKKQMQNLPTENNILCNATPEQFNTVRKLMIEAILHTDMTKHFQMVNSVRGMLIEQQEGTIKKEDLTWQTLMYMLHMADISGQAKAKKLSTQWTQRCMDEFFAQGDLETSLGMPISANCDRQTVNVAESQVGFIRFVVEPAYEVLGEYSSFVKQDVVPLIHGNLVRYMEMVAPAAPPMGDETKKTNNVVATPAVKVEC